MSSINFNQLGLYEVEGIDVLVDGSENYKAGDLTHIEYINKTCGSSATFFKGERFTEFKKQVSSLGSTYTHRDLQSTQIIIISKDVYSKLTREHAMACLYRSVAFVKLGYLFECEKDTFCDLSIVEELEADKYVVGLYGKKVVYDSIHAVVEVTAEIVAPFYGQTKEEIVKRVYANNHGNINVRLNALK